MTRNDLLITVPSYFRCPISLDVMKSPVSLCTGVTYDRSSIQQWLDGGNNTCPATNQPLRTKDFTPNHTLRRLIQIWDSGDSPSSAAAAAASRKYALELLLSLSPRSPPADLVDPLSQLCSFLQQPGDRESLVNAGALPVLLGLLSGCRNLEVIQALFRVLSLILSDPQACDKETPRLNLASVDRDALLMLLQQGDVDSRADAARALEAVICAMAAEAGGEGWAFVESEDVLAELIRLLSSETEETAACAGISCLNSLSARRKRIRSQIVRLGAVPLLGRLLSRPGCGERVPELALLLLESLSRCAEGRAAICEDAEECLPAVVQRLLKVPAEATERAVAVLWSVCHLIRDPRAQAAVAGSNGLTKILLVMQSGCSPAVRRMCGDLVKVFRVNPKSCLSRYDTNTTHIMPF